MRLLIFLLIAAAFSACTNNSEKATHFNNKLDVASIVADKNLTPSQKADRLAATAEQLLSMQGFVYAAEIADQALMMDPANLKAGFLKALIAPIIVHKGIMVRLKPLAEKTPEGAAKHATSIADIKKNWPNSTFKDFVLDGQPDIKDEADFQAYLDESTLAWSNLRKFAKANKNKELTIRVTDGMMQGMNERYGQACEVRQVSPMNYDWKCPEITSLYEVKLNLADFEMVQHFAAMMEVYFSYLGSYDLSGAIDFAIRNEGVELPASYVFNELLKNPKFGLLRTENAFKRTQELGLDYISAARWVLANQNILCKAGESSVKNRYGFLFPDGICAQADAETYNGLRKAEGILRGALVEITVSGLEKPNYLTMVQPAKFLENPMKDFRQLMPIRFNKCDEITRVADDSFFGVFPSNDFNYILEYQEICAGVR